MVIVQVSIIAATVPPRSNRMQYTEIMSTSECQRSPPEILSTKHGQELNTKSPVLTKHVVHYPYPARSEVEILQTAGSVTVHTHHCVNQWTWTRELLLATSARYRAATKYPADDHSSLLAHCFQCSYTSPINIAVRNLASGSGIAKKLAITVCTISVFPVSTASPHVELSKAGPTHFYLHVS